MKYHNIMFRCHATPVLTTTRHSRHNLVLGTAHLFTAFALSMPFAVVRTPAAIIHFCAIRRTRARLKKNLQLQHSKEWPDSSGQPAYLRIISVSAMSRLPSSCAIRWCCGLGVCTLSTHHIAQTTRPVWLRCILYPPTTPKMLKDIKQVDDQDDRQIENKSQSVIASTTHNT